MINLKQQYIKISKLGLLNRGLSITKQVPLTQKIPPNYIYLMINI